jgi:hypothetical protein
MEANGQLHTLAALFPRKGPLGTNLIRKWLWPTISLDVVESSKNLTPAGKRNLAVRPVAHHYTDWAILASSDSGRKFFMNKPPATSMKSAFMVNQCVHIPYYRELQLDPHYIFCNISRPVAQAKRAQNSFPFEPCFVTSFQFRMRAVNSN